MTTPTPTTEIEDRLRATLAAEADRHPVTPDLEGLRARRDGSDRAVVDLHLSPRRNRARILAAAVVLVVLALGATAVVRSGTGEDTDGPVTSGAGPSGYYLPGPGWDVIGVEVAPLLDQGTAREVIFVADEGYQVNALVLRATSTDDEVVEEWEADGARPVDRNDADPPVWLTEEEGTGDDGAFPVFQLAVPGDGEVLSLASTGADLDALLAVADRWVASGGDDIGIAPATGLERGYDITYADPAPVAVGGLFRNSRPPVGPAEVPLLVVTVQAPDGALAAYSLAVPNSVGRPTGVGVADRGEGAGLLPDELPEPTDGLRDDGEVWAAPTPLSTGSFVGLLPGADVGVSPSDEASVGSPQPTEDDLRDLMAGLRPVDRGTWADALRAVPGGERRWPARLAEVDPTDDVESPDEVWGPASSVAASAETVPDATELAGTVTNDLIGFATGAAVVPAARMADEVTVGFVGEGDSDLVLTGEQRDIPASWQLELDGHWGRSGPTNPLDLLVGTEVEGRSPASPIPACTGSEPAPAPRIVVIEPVSPASCLDWFALVVTVDVQGRIEAVRLALSEP